MAKRRSSFHGLWRRQNNSIFFSEMHMELQKFPKQLWLAFYVFSINDLPVAWTKPVNSLEIATKVKYYAELGMSVSPPQLCTQDWKVSDYATNTLTQLNSLTHSLARSSSSSPAFECKILCTRPRASLITDTTQHTNAHI